MHATFLDLHIVVVDYIYAYKLYDKRDISPFLLFVFLTLVVMFHHMIFAVQFRRATRGGGGDAFPALF